MSSTVASTVFWIVAALMTVAALAFLLPLFFPPRRPPETPSRLSANAAVYRSRLAEIDRETGAGTLLAAARERALAGIEQQLLADASDDGRAANLLATPRVALALSIALPLVALGLYATFGDPGAVSGNAGISTLAAAAPPASRDDLVRHLARNPRDGRAWVLLARVDFEADRYAEAGAAYERAIAASPKVAGDPAVWCEYADAMGMAQGGTLAGRPREFVMRALALDPAHPKALEMAGSAAFEARDYGTAAKHWRELLALLPAGSRSRDELAAAIARADALAGPADNALRTPAAGR